MAQEGGYKEVEVILPKKDVNVNLRGGENSTPSVIKFLAQNTSSQDPKNQTDPKKSDAHKDSGEAANKKDSPIELNSEPNSPNGAAKTNSSNTKSTTKSTPAKTEGSDKSETVKSSEESVLGYNFFYILLQKFKVNEILD